MLNFTLTMGIGHLNLCSLQDKDIGFLMIHQHYFPEMSDTVRRTKELAEYFVKQNHKISIITSFSREYRSLPNQYFKRVERLNGVVH